ncbi:MAG TPA: signal peptidase I [Mycobacteriales bacterium]
MSAPGDPPTNSSATTSATGESPERVPRALARGRTPRRRRRMLQWPILVIVAVVVAVLVRTFLLESFYIPSGSMENTLNINDRVLVDKISYHLHGIGRGDIVVFRRPPHLQISDNDLIKRVIGLPGDTLKASGGSVFVDGRKLSEPYVRTACHGTGPFGPVTVPAGKIFVMGDNRCNSYDSRYFGAISKNLVVGQAFVRIWPISRLSGL